MREKISMKPKLLGALALLTMIGALFVMQSADQYTPTADAATGTIHALNVGTCLTTDATVFKGDCDSLMEDYSNNNDDWEIRAKNTQVLSSTPPTLTTRRAKAERLGRSSKTPTSSDQHRRHRSRQANRRVDSGVFQQCRYWE